MYWTLVNLSFPAVVVALGLLWGPAPAFALAVVGGMALHSGLQARLQNALRDDEREFADGDTEADVATGDAGSWFDPVAEVRRETERLRASVQDGSFERVRSNLRMLALADLWRAVRDENPDTALYESVRAFCRQELGIHEVALLRVDARAEEISGIWTLPRAAGAARTHTVRWALSGVDGSVARALRTTRTVHVRDGAADPILRVNGEKPRVAVHAGGHVVVPLLSPAPPSECFQQGWLYRDGCPAHRAHPDALARNRRPEPGRGIDLGRCASCQHFPVRGVLVLTDAESARPLDRTSVKLVETLAGSVASVLEHAALFRDVKGAERFRDQVLDAMLNGLVSTDQHGRIVYANQRAREICRDEALEGRRLDEVVQLVGGNGALTRTLIEGKAYLQADGAAIGPVGDAERVPVRVNLTPFRPEDGGVHGAVCVMEDRSTVRAMEQEIRHLDTLAAIGRFASSLAHELRNPLGGIQAGVEYLSRSLQRQDLLDADTRENIHVIDAEIQRLDGILRQLLSVARPRDMVLTECRIQPLVDRAVATFVNLASTLDVRLESVRGEDAGPIHADADMVHQVLVNLIKNAIEASSPGAIVEVITHARRDPTGDEEFDGVVIEVLDRGAGIDDDDLARIFEPFFTRKSNGTGLGLYVCHGFVQRHDGRLWAERRPGGGTRFVLELPRVPALMGGLHATPHSGGR